MNEEYLEASASRIGNERIALGLSYTPDEVCGDIGRVRELISLIDKATNALIDAICSSGNDAKNNLRLIHRLRREAGLKAVRTPLDTIIVPKGDERMETLLDAVLALEKEEGE